MGKTKIEWTDETWNPATGCNKVSEGCRNCYAEAVANVRFAMQYPPVIENGVERDRIFTDVQCHPERLEQPLHWRKPKRIFVNSMSDLFHGAVPDEFIEYVFAMAALSRRHTFQILTKRPERMYKWFSETGDLETREHAVMRAAERKNLVVWDSRGDDPLKYYRAKREDVVSRRPWPGWPLPNVWLGVSVENRSTLHRIDHLRVTPAAVRFLSLEPLLENLGVIDLTGISWVIVGGESGHGARPCDMEWVRSIISQCKAASVPVFTKQLGAKPYSITDHISHRGHTLKMPDGFYRYLNDRKGGDWNEWPEDLRVREYPRGSDDGGRG